MSRDHDEDKRISASIANWPDRAFAQRPRRPGGNEQGSGKDDGAVNPSFNCGDTLCRAARPEGSHDPTDYPRNPDDLEDLVWLNDHALMRHTRDRVPCSRRRGNGYRPL